MPNIFISYRRNDASGHAGRLHDSLTRMFSDTVFLDVDALRAGVEFKATILQRLVPPAVAIAVIGRQWLGSNAEGTNGRLFEVDDFVRLELQSARENGTPVVPVLVNGAAMPQEKELPETLRWLTTLQAFELSDRHWEVDVKVLADELDSLLAAQRTSCKVLICIAQRHRDHKGSWDSLYHLVDQLEDRGIHVELLRIAGRGQTAEIVAFDPKNSYKYWEGGVYEKIVNQDLAMVCLWPSDSPSSGQPHLRQPATFSRGWVSDHLWRTEGVLPVCATLPNSGGPIFPSCFLSWASSMSRSGFDV